MYAVVDQTGEVRTIEPSVERAVYSAGTIAPAVQIEVMPQHGELGDAVELGQTDPASMPQIALQASGLRPFALAEVMSLSLEGAWSQLRPFFPTTRLHKDGSITPVLVYDTPTSMSRSLLGQNYKTSKETPERPSDVQGLSLLPHSMALTIAAQAGGSLPMKTLCAGASRACKASCLVYSGHNMIDVYNTQVKFARTQALLLRPQAFLRMLVENVGFHAASATRRGYEPFVRLNVFQDIPWELVLPELFSAYSAVRFYDYTKVPGRQVPPNYDLTFSFSGVNDAFVDHEMRRGRRIAVVFLLPGNVETRRCLPLPRTFLGLPVVDGDVSDIRPRDPAPSIVGLRWKLPHGQDVDLEAQENRAFVVRVRQIDGQLVATQSARQEPIVDADSTEA